MNDKLTPFCQDIMRSANRNGIDAQCNLPDWVIAEITRGIVETIWMYQRGAVTPTQMVRELVGEEAARREAEARPYVAQARLQDEPPGPRTGPSKEGAGVPRFLYPIDDELGRTTSADGVSPFAAAASSAPQGEREGPGSAAAPECDHNWVIDQEAVSHESCQKCGIARVRKGYEKPATAADDLLDRHAAPVFRELRDRIEAQAREIAEAAEWNDAKNVRIETLKGMVRDAEAENARLRDALEPFAEAARKAEASGKPPFQFCSADDYTRAALARGGEHG